MANVYGAQTTGLEIDIDPYKRVTFEGESLVIDMDRIWDLKVLYVAVSRFFTVKGSSRELIEVVVCSPPSKEKLEYYTELGLECDVVVIKNNKTGKEKEKTEKANSGTAAMVYSTTARPAPMFSDSDDE
ncbi:hypothetical protein T492DRAFT_841260 [Pavlovales sp. CCMP2436]|nr:hypothetical protein T492DRAFT_841260 [Pavlovales sp. CCMP2436]